MSKLSFRARALDASKPMPVYATEELPDLPDFSAINRAVPQMPTGMEKEEESEHHLQRAISAQQVYGSANPLVIPTPDFERSGEYYDAIYENSYKQPKQYVHVQPLSMEQDIPDYDMDAEDEEWMKKHSKNFEITSLQFEEMMDRLEKGSGQQVVTLKEAKLLLKEDDDLIIAVYDYWLNKRLKSMTGCGLIPNVRQEKRDGSTSNNPYVAFRRRTEKMQTRKNRKNDEASYEKMLKLRRDLNRAVTLLEMVKRREKSKKEAVHLTLEIFEKRFQMDDFSGAILADCEELSKRQPSFTIPAIPNGNQYSSWSIKTEDGLKKKREYKKRKHKEEKKLRQMTSSSTGEIEPTRFPDIRSSEEELSPQVQSTSDPEEETDPDGVFAFRRKKGCHYVAPHPELSRGWPWSDEQPRAITDNRYRYSCTSLREPRRCIGLARRRVGRGGRVLLDRAWTPFQNYKELDDCLLNPPPTEPIMSPLRSPSASSSQTSLPLSVLLDEIRAKRMLHFRPKTPPPPIQPAPSPPLPQLPPSQVPMEESLESLLPSGSFPTIETPSRLPQQILTDSDGVPEGDVAPTQTLPSLAPSDSIVPLLESQDLQTVEVDVVNSDSSSELNTSFGSLPTSRFTLEPSRELTKHKSIVVEPLPVLVPPTTLKVKENHANTVNTLLNHKALLEATTKVPTGHSTAPAATVLQLNYPLGVAKPSNPTAATPTTTTPSNAQTPNDGIVTNSVDVIMQSSSEAGVVSDSLLKGNLMREKNKGGFDGTNVVVSSTQNVSLANAVKRISQANNIDVISRDKHEDSNHSLDSACIPNNKSVVMEVT